MSIRHEIHQVANGIEIMVVKFQVETTLDMSQLCAQSRNQILHTSSYSDINFAKYSGMVTESGFFLTLSKDEIWRSRQCLAYGTFQSSLNGTLVKVKIIRHPSDIFGLLLMTVVCAFIIINNSDNTVTIYTSLFLVAFFMVCRFRFYTGANKMKMLIIKSLHVEGQCEREIKVCGSRTKLILGKVKKRAEEAVRQIFQKYPVHKDRSGDLLY